MTPTQWIGLALMMSPVVGAFIVIAVSGGLRVALGIFAATGVVMAIVCAGAYLMRAPG